MKYAAYNEHDYICNVEAESEAEALENAKALNPESTRVELVSEVENPREV